MTEEQKRTFMAMAAIVDGLAALPEPLESDGTMSGCCWFCGADREASTQPHKSDCLWLQARALATTVSA